MNRESIENATLELDDVLAWDVAEEVFQSWFERHPVVFRALSFSTSDRIPRSEALMVSSGFPTSSSSRSTGSCSKSSCAEFRMRTLRTAA